MTRGARGAACAILLVLLAATGCEERDRSNPFDPENPGTGGVPAILDAIAGNREVRLVWSARGFTDLGTAFLLRASAGDSSEVALTPAGIRPEVGGFTDSAVVNGRLYRYRMEFRLESGDVLTSATDEATPGNRVVWIIDSDGAGLIRMSPDGRDVVRRTAQGGWLLDLDVDLARRSVWIADYLGGTVDEVAWDGGLVLSRDLVGARALALDPDGATLWASSYARGILERQRIADGRVVYADSVAGSVEDLQFTQAGVLWAAVAEGELRLYEENRLISTVTQVTRPVALARDEGGILVLDRGDKRVRRYDPYGIPRGRSEAVLTDPTDIASDGAGGAYVADAGRGGIVRFGPDLVETGRIESPGVLGLTVDPRDGSIWAVGVAGLRVYGPAGEEMVRRDVGNRTVEVEIVHE